MVEGETISVPVVVSDDLESARADGEMRPPVLTLRFAQFCVEDDVEFRFNGRVLPTADAEITDELATMMPLSPRGSPFEGPLGVSAHWFRWKLDTDLLREGKNVVEVEAKRTGQARRVHPFPERSRDSHALQGLRAPTGPRSRSTRSPQRLASRSRKDYHMPETMKAVRKAAPEPGLVIDDIPVPEVGRGEVLVGVEAASVCGTDLHIWKWDDWAASRVKPPLTIGHEFAGAVVEIGPDVTQVRVGDYVSAESHITCGLCFQCRTGQAHMCPRTKILGVDRDGVFAEYVSVPETVVWQNDREKLPPEIATLQEPFGNAVFATLAHDLAGQSVAVLGCGPVGLFSIGIAKASGAFSVLAADINDYRLSLAQALGADKVYNASADGTNNGVADWLIETNEGFGVDIVLEMSGAASSVDAAFRGVRNGGRVTLFGIPAKPVLIDVAESMIFKNLTVLALNGRRIFDTWYKTRWLLESKVVDLRPIISKEVGLEEIETAMQLLDAGDVGKIIIRPNAALDVTPAPVQEAPPDPNVQGQLFHP